MAIPFLMVLMLFTPVATAASPFQSLDRIRAVAKDYVGGQVALDAGEVHIEVGRLDPRLRLAACEQPLEAFSPVAGSLRGNTTVGVRCNGAKPWSLYVPVSVRLIQEVVVTARALARGSLLSTKDLRMEQRNIGGLSSGYFTELPEVLGKNLTRSLGEGVVLNPTVVKAPILVRRGQRVTLLAETNGIEVRMAVKAMSDGSAGDLIRVRNLRSKRIIEGIVDDDGIVKIQI
jgi:flagella basal body P-ring formation protein FlgA